jgi:hypothetical protein
MTDSVIVLVTMDVVVSNEVTVLINVTTRVRFDGMRIKEKVSEEEFEAC